MALFYFHLRDGDHVATDEVGVDLPDIAAARSEAEQSARELIADAIKARKRHVPEAFIITDEQGWEIATIPLSTVLPQSLKN